MIDILRQIGLAPARTTRSMSASPTIDVRITTAACG
jgi:hypothetical protein